MQRVIELRRTAIGAAGAPLLVALAIPGVATVAACSSSTQASQPVGPVYTFDGGVDVAVDNVPDASDATGPGPVDATSHPAESGADAGPGDANTATDAVADSTTSSDASAVPDAGACPSGSGTLALLGGASTLAFAAVSKDGSAWVVSPLAGTNVGATPGLVALSGGFLGVFPTAGAGVLDSTGLATPGSGAWSTPIPIAAVAGGDAAATEVGAPSLAVLGPAAELVYAGSNFKFFHGGYASGAWTAASDPVGGAGAAQDYGPSAPSAASSAGTLFAAYDGGNGGLYVDSWTSGAGWAGAAAIPGAGVGAVPPSLAALTGGTSGGADLLLVFEVPSTNLAYSVEHTPGAGRGTWSAPLAIDASAAPSSAVSLAPIGGGRAVMTFVGAGGLPFASTYTSGPSPAWSKPALIYPNAIPLAAPPTVAAGVCGFDAVAAFVQAAGVEVVTMTAGVWSPPTLVAGTAQMTFAAVATTP